MKDEAPRSIGQWEVQLDHAVQIGAVAMLGAAAGQQVLWRSAAFKLDAGLPADLLAFGAAAREVIGEPGRRRTSSRR